MCGLSKNGSDWCTVCVGQLGARSGMKMLRVQGREKKYLAFAQFACSRHSDLSGEARMKEGKERETKTPFSPGKYLLHISLFTPHIAIIFR